MCIFCIASDANYNYNYNTTTKTTQQQKQLQPSPDFEANGFKTGYFYAHFE